MEQDEIYLIDLWHILYREWRWFVAVLVVITCRAQPSAVHSLARKAADAVALNPDSSASG